MRMPWLATLVLVVACAPGADEELVGERTSAVTVPTTLIGREETWWAWPYPDVEPSWRTLWPDSNDWRVGKGPLGYGESYIATPLSYGDDAAHKTITAYFQKSFYVEDPAAFVSLRLDAMYDDGFVAYLNGTEVTRVGMPAGPVTPATLALGHEAMDQYVGVNVNAVLPRLHAGWNMLAIEVHQGSPSSSDLVFDASLVAQAQVPPPPSPSAPRGGIPRRSLWSYWDRGGDPGSAWASSWDGATWPEGSAPLGYGESYLATPIRYGPSASDKYVTTYFRKRFVVTDPAAVIALHAELMFDDGVVVYLNGHRIASYSMPAGTPTGGTLALPHEASERYQRVDWSEVRTWLRAGENTLAVEVHQASRASSDLVLDLALAVETRAASSIPRGSVWSYWDRGGSPGTSWRELGFDAATWSTGNGPLGYGESYLVSTTSRGPTASSQSVTTCFRKQLRIENLAAVRQLELELMYDDGAVVYVNGHEIARRSMPSGEVTAATWALGHEANDTYEAFSWDVVPGVLVAGDNQIAVEVHQASASSSDLVFDLAIQPTLAPSFVTDGAGPMVTPSGAPDGPTHWRAMYVMSPKVLHLAEQGLWVMYYTANGQPAPTETIGRAWSTDGVHWQQDEAPTGAGSHVAAVAYDGRTFYLWSTAYGTHGLFLATSSDGVRWSADLTHPLLKEASQVTVIFDEGVLKMWYDGAFGPALATSTDGAHWTFAGPVAGRLPGTVVRMGDAYWGWFDDGSSQLVFETSPDGLSWTPRGTTYSGGAPGSWDQSYVTTPWAVSDGDTITLWYAGRDYTTDTGYQIGDVTSR